VESCSLDFQILLGKVMYMGIIVNGLEFSYIVYDIIESIHQGKLLRKHISICTFWFSGNELFSVLFV